jgi:hypothetical protein
MAQFESIRFQPSRPLLRELSADRLNTILQEIRRNRPKADGGITVRQSGDGTYIGLAAPISSSSSATSESHPFQILTRTDPETNNTFLGVRPNSFVFFRGVDTITPTGLLVDPSDENDDGWTPRSSTKYIWLEFDVDEGTSIQFGNEDDFDPRLNPFTSKSILEDNGSTAFPEFQKARRIIAEIIEEDESFTISQYMKAHQTFADVVVNGIPAGYFYEWGGGLPPEV